MLKHFLALILLVASVPLAIAAAPVPTSSRVVISATQEDSPAPIFVVPDQKIQGAEDPIPKGEIVDLTLTPIKLKPTYLASTSYTWLIPENGKPKKLRSGSDGGIWFAAGLEDKTLYAHCAITHLYIVKDKDGKVTQVATKTILLIQKVIVGAGSPQPGPGPGPGPAPTPPTPGPDPVFPDGQYKLSGLSYKTAMSKVTDATARTKGSAALVTGYEGVASAIAAGTITDLTKALSETKARNNKALADATVDASKWEAFSLDLQEAVYALYKDKKINSAADLGIAWKEVADGLKKVK